MNRLVVGVLVAAAIALSGCAGQGPHPLVEHREAQEHEERIIDTFCMESGSRDGALQKGGKDAEETYEVACE